LVLDSSALLEERAPSLEPNGSPAWLVGQVILRSGRNTAIGVPLGFEAGTGLSSLTTSLASGLSIVGDATNIGAELDGPGGLGLSTSM
jgi:hypothetical protein